MDRSFRPQTEGVPPFPSGHTYCASCYKPQNKYLSMLLEEFERTNQQSMDMSKLKKEIATIRKDLGATQREIKDVQFDAKVLNDRVSVLTKETTTVQHLNKALRDEASNEFRNLYKRVNKTDKDVDLLKYKVQMNNKKYSLDLEAMRWELATQSRRGSTAPANGAPRGDFRMDDMRYRHCDRRPDDFYMYENRSS